MDWRTTDFPPVPRVTPLVFLELPEFFLDDCFLELGLVELARCRRVSKAFNSFLIDSPVLLLHYELLAANLISPSVVRQRTSARAILEELRERQRRFRTLDYSNEFSVDLEADEGRLYEYLEGILLRGNGLATAGSGRRGLPNGTTLYDLTGQSDWDDVQEVDETSAAPETSGEGKEEEEEEEVVVTSEDDAADHYTKRKWSSPFEVKDITMDPGQDLFVAAEIDRVGAGPRPYKLHIHLMTLSAFKPHPHAVSGGRLDSVLELPVRAAAFTLQICDDVIYVYSSVNTERVPQAHTVAWNWKSGQFLWERKSKTVDVTRESGIEIHEDFSILKDKHFCIITYTASPQLPGIRDLELLCTLNVYHIRARPMMDVDVESEEDVEAKRRTPSHETVLLGRFVLPAFRQICDVAIRADPPPRQTFSFHKPLSLYPNPDTGLLVLTFNCADGHPLPPGQSQYYVLFLLKERLLSWFPQDLLDQAKEDTFQPLLITWDTLAPYTRFKSDIEQQGWVTFLYGSRFLSGSNAQGAENPDDRPSLRHAMVWDFEPNRVKMEIQDRKWKAVDRRRSARIRGLKGKKRKAEEREGEGSKRTQRLSDSTPSGEDHDLVDRPPPTRRTRSSSILSTASSLLNRFRGIPLDDEPPPSGPSSTIQPSVVDEDVIDFDDLDGWGADGVYLGTKEDVVSTDNDVHLRGTVRTGSKFPYLLVRDKKARVCQGLMIDDARIVMLHEKTGKIPARLHVMNL